MNRLKGDRPINQIILKTATVTQHISSTGTQTTVVADPIEALKAIGELTGLYHPAVDRRDQRVVVREHDESGRILVIEEDISRHGSPCWEYVRTLETDQRRIDEYLAFKEVMKAVQQRLSN